MAAFWQEVFSRPREVYQRLDRSQRLAVLAMSAVALTIIVISSVLASRTSYSLLYAGLDQEEASKIVSQLERDGVPFRLGGAGDLIEVPEEDVHRARLRLAGAGLPAGGGVGFEIFNDNQLGLTDSLFSVNKQRALQGELERAIETSSSVRRARVLIDLPPRGLFLRDRRRATASVTLGLRPSSHLDEGNIYAIAHLVAAGIGHGMKPSDVTIVDSDLNHLHPTEDPDNPLFSSGHLQRVARLEDHLQRKAESQLALAVGPGKALVRVNVDLDLTHKESQKEMRSEDNKVTLREETTSRTAGDAPSGGDPSVSGAVPGSGGSSESTDETFTDSLPGLTRELSVTAPGAVRNLSVALLLDESDEALLAKMEDLGEIVKATVGFQDSRGDLFTVRTIAFAAEPVAEPEAGFDMSEIYGLAGHLTEAITVLFVLIFLTRALRGSRDKKVRGAAGAEEVPVEEETDVRKRLARTIAERPDQARETLVNWLREEVVT